MFWYFIFLVLLLHDNHVQPVCTFLSCTFLLILILSLQYTVMHILLYFIFCSLYLIFYLFNFNSSVLYSIIFALSMERTWLTFHCWLYTLYIIVYVTNKNLESWTFGLDIRGTTMRNAKFWAGRSLLIHVHPCYRFIYSKMAVMHKRNRLYKTRNVMRKHAKHSLAHVNSFSRDKKISCVCRSLYFLLFNIFF